MASKISARATDQGQTVIVSSTWAGTYVDLLHSVLGAFEYQKLECLRGANPPINILLRDEGVSRSRVLSSSVDRGGRVSKPSKLKLTLGSASCLRPPASEPIS